MSKVTRIADWPAHEPPGGHHNRLERIKYVDVPEFLADCEAMAAAQGVTDCPVCAYLRGHLDDDIIEVEHAVWSDPSFGPALIGESLRNTLRFNNAGTGPHGERTAAVIQWDLALAARDLHPWGVVRPHLERALRHPDMRFASGEAAFVILALFAANHPNPRVFLGQHEVWPKFERFGADLERFPAPDFDLQQPREKPFGH